MTVEVHKHCDAACYLRIVLVLKNRANRGEKHVNCYVGPLVDEGQNALGSIQLRQC